MHFQYENIRAIFKNIKGSIKEFSSYPIIFNQNNEMHAAKKRIRTGKTMINFSQIFLISYFPDTFNLF